MQVSERHAVVKKDSDGSYFVTDLASTTGTWLNNKRLTPDRPVRLCPGDELEFGCREEASLLYRVKLVHTSVWEQLGAADSGKGPSGAATNGKASASQELAAV